MLLSITNRSPDATNLGWLLHKHPDKVQEFPLSFGVAHVFYPEVSDASCTAALLIDVDPVGLVRKHRGSAFSADQYVNDRPYAVSSLMSVAIGKVFGTAMSGRCKDRPELEGVPLDLNCRIPVLPARRGGKELIRQLFEPLGYVIEVKQLHLDKQYPEWGDSSYYSVTLSKTCLLSELLTHLYVLVPVLDNEKHYWIGEDEIQKLLEKGQGWLSGHPEQELIVKRYLRYRHTLTRNAFERLVEQEQASLYEEEDGQADEEEEIERTISLNEQRHAGVVAVLKAAGARSVIDLGCAEGRLLRRLLDERQFNRIIGLDVSLRVLEKAEKRLKLDRLPVLQRKRIELMHGSLLYRDARLDGIEAACLIDVIEHLDQPRLSAAERTVFEFMRPKCVIVTTPNAEYNVRFETLFAGTMRHKDHRFEWTRKEFADWAEKVAEKHGYTVRFLAVGQNDPEVGPPTQMGVFELCN